MNGEREGGAREKYEEEEERKRQEKESTPIGNLGFHAGSPGEVRPRQHFYRAKHGLRTKGARLL
jgi:hypothetical protein